MKDKATLYFYLQSYNHREFPALGAYSKFVDTTNRYSVELRAFLAVVVSPYKLRLVLHVVSHGVSDCTAALQWTSSPGSS